MKLLCQIGLALLLMVLMASCKKYLDKKPDHSMNVPATLSDLQMILDNYGIMNTSFPNSTEVLADNYYLTTGDWSSIANTTLRNYYIWQKDDQSGTEWTAAYRTIFYSNVVLDALEDLGENNVNKTHLYEVKGAALFFRSFAFYTLLQLFAPPYDNINAAKLPGIPLRLNSDFTEPTQRATLEFSYNQIIQDFKLAATYLPEVVNTLNRPSKTAAYAALARIYLVLGNYNNALLYSDSALQLYNTLIDYNTLNGASASPIVRFNNEVIFSALSSPALNLAPSRAKIDSVLFNSYDDNDLRKTILFRANGNGTYSFKGSYDGSSSGSVFLGFTTSELLLIKAEALARMNNTGDAMETLNKLMIKRWKNGTFSPFTAGTSTEALNIILNERRKELIFRGHRWTDLRRLNKEQQFAVTLFRNINNQTYVLAPGNERYTLLIPKQVIDLTGITQNL